MFTDSHAHLYLSEFNNDLDNVIQNAINNKVNRFLLPNIDNETLPKLLSVCNKYRNLFFPMIGLHPCGVKNNYLDELEKLYSHIDDALFIAVGEIGIDMYWETKFIVEQKEAFRVQINWAKKHSLPIVIHSRNSFNEIYEILSEKESENITGVFHCFSGTHEEALKIIEIGFYLGIGGVLTFKNSNLSEVIKLVDLKHIILETDSPYLAPHPMRGKRNEPKFLPRIAEKIAEIKKISIKQVCKITNQNIDSLFFYKNVI